MSFSSLPPELHNVDHENSIGLVRAVGIGSLSATCWFLSLPRVNVHVRNDAGQTILHHRPMTVVRLASCYGTMILMGYKEAVKKLLDDTRLDPNLTSHDLSPLAIAAGSGLMKLLEMLLSDQRVAVNSQIHGFIDLFIWALFRRGEGSSLRLLCAPNVNVNCCWYIISALMWGILLEQTAVVGEILKKDQIDMDYALKSGNSKRLGEIRKV
ncbi:hypothetical protein BJX63DRAFT_426626 [Aspergillus granulosus]|uniref:Uncharacterized protein n=1 Tax=Aspergillus granulosus TaxID=176169 RepID=A0ABR4GRB3_9EURO